MNAKSFPMRAGMLFAAAASFAMPAIAGSSQPPAQQQVVALAAPRPEAVLDSASIAPLGLMIFVHRPDLPLRAAPTKHKEHS